ncbi:MAG: hypothetical protein WC506_02125 [Candidatus Micrarchaeia archaeon]
MEDLSEKYRPSRFEDFLGNRDAVDAVRKWALEWARGRSQKPLIITGPCGSGKTTLAMLGAKAHGWDMNFSTPSETRNADSLSRSIGFSTTSATLFGKMRLVIFEDVDLTFRQDREGIKTMAALAAQSKNPVIFTATDFWEQKISPLRYACTHIELKRLTTAIIAKALERISIAEKIDLTASQIDAIAKNSGEDLRAAINDLQSKNVNSSRDREKNIYETTRAVFHSGYAEARSAVFACGEEHDDIKAWVGWNLPLEYQDAEGTSSGAYAHAIESGFEAVSRADMFDGRIMKRQYWVLLKYSSDLLSAGVAASRNGAAARYVKYERPPFNYKFSGVFGNAKKAARKIAREAHCNIRDAPWFFPIIAAQFKAHPNHVRDFWGFETEELAFVCKSTESSVKDKLEKDKESYEKREKEREGLDESDPLSKKAERREKDAASQLLMHEEKKGKAGHGPEDKRKTEGKAEAAKHDKKTDSKKHEGAKKEKDSKEPKAEGKKEEKPVKKAASLADFM